VEYTKALCSGGVSRSLTRRELAPFSYAHDPQPYSSHSATTTSSSSSSSSGGGMTSTAPSSMSMYSDRWKYTFAFAAQSEWIYNIYLYIS
jgi:hypothetical protein